MTEQERIIARFEFIKPLALMLVDITHAEATEAERQEIKDGIEQITKQVKQCKNT